MLTKLIANRYLDLPDVFKEQALPQKPAFPAHFVESNYPIFNIAESETEGGTRMSSIGTGALATKAHRTFRWLAYVKGKVTYLPYAGADILTGKMSGCWITVFKHGGTSYVAHIGTDDFPDTPNSKQAKKAWRDAETSKAVTLVKAFNPVGPDLPNKALEKRDKAKEFYAAVETSGGGGFFTVVLGNKSTTPGPGPRKIYNVFAMAPKMAIKFMGE